MKADYLQQVKRYNFRSARPRAGRCALLVIDMQEFFRAMAEPILPRVNNLVDACRAAGVPVFFTRHGHRDLSVDGGMLARWWDTLAMRDTPDWQLMEGLHVRPEDRVLDKDRYSAFRHTDLDERLRALGMEELIVAGVTTNCCCETTARDAFVRDYRVFFVADATAADGEELHLSSLRNLAYGFAHILTADLLCQALA